jgi:hypothetical protein
MDRLAVGSRMSGQIRADGSAAAGNHSCRVGGPRSGRRRCSASCRVESGREPCSIAPRAVIARR